MIDNGGSEKGLRRSKMPDERTASGERGSAFVLRSLAYSLGSILAAVSAFIIAPSHNWGVLPLILIVVSPFPFFIGYTKLFYSHDPVTRSRQRVRFEDAQFHTWIELLLVIAMLALSFRVVHGSFPPISLSVTLLVPVVIIYAHLWYLDRLARRDAILPMRHRLVWPAITSVTLPVYLALTLAEARKTLPTLFLVSVLFVFFVVSEVGGLRTWTFALTSVVLFAGFCVAPALYQDSYRASAMSLGLTVAAYLAVFESWRVASQSALAHRERCASLLDWAGRGRVGGRPGRFWAASAVGLGLSAVLMPLVYLPNAYGTIFLFGFVIHAGISFAYWYVKPGSGGSALEDSGRLRTQAVFAGTYLAILVIDSMCNLQPRMNLGSGGTLLTGLGTLMALVTWPAKQLFDDLREHRERFPRGRLSLIIAVVFEKKVNTLRLVSSCAVVCAGIALLVRAMSAHLGPKADLAFVAYSAIVLAAFVANIVENFYLPGKGKEKVSRFVRGTAQSTRLFLSLGVGFAVVAPVVRAGYAVSAGLLYALPFVLASMGGFALNDYHDAARDMVNKQHRAIPSGKMSRRAVWMVGVICLGAAVGLAALAGEEPVEWFLYGCAIVGVVSYNHFVRFCPTLKGVFTSALCALPVVFDVIHLKLTTGVMLLPACAFLYILGREILMDTLDIDADLSVGLRTLPAVVGTRWTTIIGMVFLGVSYALLVPVASRSSGNVFLGVIAFSLGATACCLWWWRGGYRWSAIRLLLFPMPMFVLMVH